MAWWVWVSIGILCLISEVFTTAFVLMFFSLGAFAAALLSVMPFGTELWLQLLVFGISSIIFLWFLRPKVYRWSQRDDDRMDRDSFIGKEGVCLTDIPSGERGEVEYRGTTWLAQNNEATALQKGERCLIRGSSGLLLDVKRIQE